MITTAHPEPSLRRAKNSEFPSYQYVAMYKYLEDGYNKNKYIFYNLIIKQLSGLIQQMTHTDDIFPFFPQITGFDISCKLSPMETICMKCQNPFSRKSKKSKKNISIILCRLL